MPEILNRDCECWEHNISLVLLDRGLVKEIVLHIYCPRCSRGIKKNDACMLGDKGWLIEFDPRLLKHSVATAYFVHNSEETPSLKLPETAFNNPLEGISGIQYPTCTYTLMISFRIRNRHHS
ncbi:MAG: hypothetical protein IT393_04975 [Nitrospirae bacterium]|nr:hypothetical protein [Nitrospirota bacterium]